MPTVFAEITMSLDGFVAGENISVQQPMGANGLRLHDWIFGKKTAADSKLLEEVMNDSGAVIVGNHTYTTAIPDAWDKQSPFPCTAFVVCHKKPTQAVAGFIYSTTSIEETLAEARKTAGAKKVWIMGGASIIRQYLRARLVDELNIHIAPILLGRGTRLFDDSGNGVVGLETVRVMETPGGVHVRYVVKE